MQASSACLFDRSVSLLKWSREDVAKGLAPKQEAREKIRAEIQALKEDRAQREEDAELQANLKALQRSEIAAVRQARAKLVETRIVKPQQRLLHHAPEARLSRLEYEERSRAPKRPVSSSDSDGGEAELEAKLLALRARKAKKARRSE